MDKTEEKNGVLSTTTQDMKLAIVALDLGKDSNNGELRCEDGRAGWYEKRWGWLTCGIFI